MDKYTVDLDQVLNDFEYSELTDQHSRQASEKPPNGSAFSTPPVTKHSITNVFHSLNEYLNVSVNAHSENLHSSVNNDNNSSVGSKEEAQRTETGESFAGENVIQRVQSLVELENNVLESTSVESYKENVGLNEPQGESQQVVLGNAGDLMIQQDIGQILFDGVQEGVNNENSKLTHEVSEKDIKEEHQVLDENLDVEEVQESNHSFLANQDEILPDFNGSHIENISKLETEPLCINNEETVKDNIENNCDTSDYKADSIKNVGFEDIHELLDEKEQKTCESFDECCNLENIEENKTTDKLLDIDLIEKNVDFGNCVNNYLENSSVHKKETLDDSNVEQDRILNESHHSENLPNVSPKIEVPKIAETIVAEFLPETISKTNEPGIKPQPVGFSKHLDVDESELNQMLADLELEENIMLEGNDLKLPVGLNKEDTIDKVQSDDSEALNLHKNLSETKEIEDIVQSILALRRGTDEVILSISDPKTSNLELEEASTVIKNNLKSEQLEVSNKDTNNFGTEVIECLEVEKSQKLTKLSNKKLNSSKKKSSEESLEAVETYCTDEATATTVIKDSNLEENTFKPIIDKEQSQETLPRPHDLPLNNELKGDGGSKRKIDLIGSPGSTPYNNVYVNRTLDTKIVPDSESDYTSSASPTFSDCSTESTSTASTASVEDAPRAASGSTSDKNKSSDVSCDNNKDSSDNIQNSGVDESNEGNTVPSDNDNNVQDNTSDNLATSNASLPRAETGAGDTSTPSTNSETFLDKSWLGKEAPLWIPDADASACLHCDMKFTLVKRRHHCRACGLVLCSKCCNLKFRLEYLDTEARVCNKCFDILSVNYPNENNSGQSSSDQGTSTGFRPNPNNPLEYCSTVSPLQQAGQVGAPPPSVMVPVGVLKRQGSNKKSNKSVMFCDGIAPGSDLTNLDQDFNYNQESKLQKPAQTSAEEPKKQDETPAVDPWVKPNRNVPEEDPDTGCFIPKNETKLPPIVDLNEGEAIFHECPNTRSLLEKLKKQRVVFAINQNLYVSVKVISMDCCINKVVWFFGTEGLLNVGSDEIIYLLEFLEEEVYIPKDIFFHIHTIWKDAKKGVTIKELGLSLHNRSNFLDSRNHAGFVYIRPTFQCLDKIPRPIEQYLIGILIHRWEIPWAKLFPLRLVLRLGAEYRYYPCPIISTRLRDSVFVEVGHTIINLLADFRNFSYSLPEVRGLVIHMEDKKTTIKIPSNRYDQVIKLLNNSSEHILAFAGNFSSEADSHLVCIQDTQGHDNVYTTHAINIHKKPRKITGASFIVFNGSLKSSSGLTAKSNIVEDGLMIQIPSEHLNKIRDDLRRMRDHHVPCGCVNAPSDETVSIVWGPSDRNFNKGVYSQIDGNEMAGIPSIRVHDSGKFYGRDPLRFIQWTEVFIIKSGEENSRNLDPINISNVSETIGQACCNALVDYLERLLENYCQKIGIRVNMHVDGVSYEAASEGNSLPPVCMDALDNALIPVLHRITASNNIRSRVVLELILRIMYG